MRIQGVSDIESSNKFVPEFIESYNTKFAVEPVSPIDAHQLTIPDNKNLDLILCHRHIRNISKNLQVRYNNKIYQIQTTGMGYTMRNAKVLVNENKGEITLVYKNKSLPYKIFNPNQRPTPVVDSKELNQHLNKKKKYRPSEDHPWNRTAILVPRPQPLSGSR